MSFAVPALRAERISAAYADFCTEGTAVFADEVTLAACDTPVVVIFVADDQRIRAAVHTRPRISEIEAVLGRADVAHPVESSLTVFARALS